MIPIEFSLLIAYFLILIIIGFIASRNEKSEEYLIAGRKLGSFSIAFSIAASFIGGNAIVNFTGYVYTYGAAVIWALLGTILGFIIVIPMANKIKKYSDDRQFYTLADYFSFKYGRNTGSISTIIIMVWYTMSICAQFIAGAAVIQSISDLSYSNSVLIMGIIIFVYLFLGGINSVVKTDIFQYLLFLGLLLIAVYSMSQGVEVDLSSFVDFKDVGIGRLLSFFILAMGYVISTPTLWQRVYAGKGKKENTKGLILASVFYIFAIFLIGFLGIIAKKALFNIKPEQAALNALNILLPSGLKSIGVVLFFAVIMSSIDTNLFIVSNNFSNDIWNKFINKKTSLVKSTRISLLGFTLIPIVISILFQDILALSLSFLSIGLSFVPILIGSFYFSLKPKAVRLALLSAFIAVLILLSLGMIYPETSIVSLPVSLVMLLIGQICFKKQAKTQEIV